MGFCQSNLRGKDVVVNDPVALEFWKVYSKDCQKNELTTSENPKIRSERFWSDGPKLMEKVIDKCSIEGCWICCCSIPKLCLCSNLPFCEVELIPTVFTKVGAEGDFNYMMTLEEYEYTLFIFYANLPAYAGKFA